MQGTWVPSLVWEDSTCLGGNWAPVPQLGFPDGSDSKASFVMQGTWVRSLGREGRLLCFVILFGLRKQEMADLCDYAIFRTKMTQFKRKHYLSSEVKGQVCKQIPSMEMMMTSTSQKERRTWHVTSWIICLNCPFLNMCLQCRRPGFDPWAGKGPWRTEWQPTPLFLPGEFHGQRNLASYSSWGHKELDMTEVTEL